MTTSQQHTFATIHSSAKVKQAIDDFRNGRFVIIVDDEQRENEGDFVIAAEKITPEAINFMSRYGRGLICLPMTGEYLDRLSLPLMVNHNTSKNKTAFTVSIGARHGITTGISAYDRARTVQVAINPLSTHEDLSVPGHIFPLRAEPGGVLQRPGHTEASVDLALLAGMAPAAVLCEIMNLDGTMARRDDLIKISQEYGLTILSIADLISYRISKEIHVHETASALLPLKSYGNFQIKIYESTLDASQHIVLLSEKNNSVQPTLVRVHSQCMTGDIFGSARCDCGWQLDYSLSQIGKEGGVLLYMNQEGRGIGLMNKIKAYALQDDGIDTVEANQKLGFSADLRDYALAAHILKQLGLQKIRLLTNNPLKISGIEQQGIEVLREAIEMEPTEDNVDYLRTKRAKLGHLLSLI